MALARRQGARAIEGWPTSRATPGSPDAFVGREPLFVALGFRPIGQPLPGRTIMRLDLG